MSFEELNGAHELASKGISQYLPRSTPAAVCGVTRADDVAHVLGVSVRAEGFRGVLMLTIDNAQWLLDALTEQVAHYRARIASQSPTSSGNANADGSPQDGQ